MDINKKPFPLATLCGIRDRIDTNPDYQRPPVWSMAQKQFLIDTILRGYDVPKLYLHRIGRSPDRYEVIDGQQRIRAIWEFADGDYKLPNDTEPINGHNVAGLTYHKLPDELRVHFDVYAFDIVVVETEEDELIRDMFLRLQNGTTLKAAEKRNAMNGAMREWVAQLAKHPFFENCGFQNYRFAFDQVAAQMTLLEIEGEPANTKDADLKRMYETNTKFDFNSGDGKRVSSQMKRALDFLARAFCEKTPELQRFTAISLYFLVSTLYKTHVIKGIEPGFRDWFIDFEQRRRDEAQKPVDERDPELVTYHEYISHGTNSADSVRLRHEVLSRDFFMNCPDLPRLDNQRVFTYEQRLAIYRRAKGECQWQEPDGTIHGCKLDWSDWHADHIVPWSKGGPTVVSNGQALCSHHNLLKSDLLQS